MTTPPIRQGDIKVVCFECGCPKDCQKQRAFKVMNVLRVDGKLDVRLVEE